MKRLMRLGLLIPALIAISQMAVADSTPKTLFACTIGAKTVSITAAGERVTFHYGTAKKDEMTIVGSAASKNVFEMSQRYAGMEYQLRFTNAGVSYIVYSMEGNPQVGAGAISGLLVLRGTKTIADKSCARWSEVTLPDNLTLPQDTAAYSAM